MSDSNQTQSRASRPADDDPGPGGWTEEMSQQFLEYGRFFVPDRERQMETLVGLLSDLEGPCCVLELCCGEGLLAERFLDRLPACTMIGLDGSAEMLRRARERLARFADRFRCAAFDLAAHDWREAEAPLNAVVSSMAVHHLDGPEKQVLFRDVCRMLTPGGVFAIADIVDPQTTTSRRLAGETWDEVVRQQARIAGDPGPALEFFQRVGWNTLLFPDPDDIDKPSPLNDQLRWLEAAGFVDVDVHWMLAGHAVFSGRKPGSDG